MWVERHPNQFSNGDTIAAVNRSTGARYEGNVHSVDNTLVRIDVFEESSTTQFSPYYYRFYGWSPSGKPAVDESKIRLHAPISKLNDADAPKCAVVLVGEQEYKVKPGDHLRVWWEDGALWSELVQGS